MEKGKEIIKATGNDIVLSPEIANLVMKNHFEKTTFNDMLGVQDVLMDNLDHELVSQGEEPAHFFTNGMYMRALKIPQGELICGKTHKHSHFTLLTKGSCIILDERDQSTEYFAPCQWVSQAGVKRFIYAYEDCELVTCHKTDKLTPQEVEDEIIIKEYL